MGPGLGELPEAGRQGAQRCSVSPAIVRCTCPALMGREEQGEPHHGQHTVVGTWSVLPSNSILIPEEIN